MFLIKIFLTSFIAGLLGTFSPCIYPLIPITLTVIGIRNYDSNLHRFKIVLSYVSGMVLLYTVLGIIFAYAGMLAGSTLQSPWINGLLFLLLFTMALNLMGVVSWNFPSSLIQKIIKIKIINSNNNVFLMGLVAGIVAFPCTGPVLTGILTMILEKQNPIQGSLLMGFYALGMGFPFLLLGTFSSFINKLPKSGPWMNSVKLILGIAMLFTSFHYGKLSFNGFTHYSDTKSIAEQISDAKAKNKYVILDFWADWCRLCHELDEQTFSDPRVIKALKKYVIIRIDVSVGSEEYESLQDFYNVVGLPTLIFENSKKKITGFIGPDDLLEFLAKNNTPSIK